MSPCRVVVKGKGTGIGAVSAVSSISDTVFCCSDKISLPLSSSLTATRQYRQRSGLCSAYGCCSMSVKTSGVSRSKGNKLIVQGGLCLAVFQVLIGGLKQDCSYIPVPMKQATRGRKRVLSTALSR